MKPEIRALAEALERHGYIAEPEIATALYLAREMCATVQLGRVAPGLTDAEPGVGGDPSGLGLGYTPERVARRTLFDACPPNELAAMERVVLRLARLIAAARSRRLVPVRGRGVPDRRRSFRRAVATEGDLLGLAHRARANRTPRPGDRARLTEAMRTIRARARSVLWLNRLAGDPDYAPAARGMAAALPFLDALLPARDAASLERLLPHLAA